MTEFNFSDKIYWSKGKYKIRVKDVKEFIKKNGNVTGDIVGLFFEYINYLNTGVWNNKKYFENIPTEELLIKKLKMFAEKSDKLAGDKFKS